MQNMRRIQNSVFGITKQVMRYRTQRIQTFSLNDKSLFFGSKSTEEKKTDQNEEKQENIKKDQENQENKETQKTEESAQGQTLLDKLLCKMFILEVKDDVANKKIKEEFKKLEDEIKILQNKQTQLQNKCKEQEKNQEDTQKKVNELRKNLKQQIEDNELALKRLTKQRFYFREKEQTKQFAIVNFAKEMLDVHDNLDRALESSKDLENQNNSLYEGVRLTKNVLEQVFKRNQIVRVYPLDEKFDPNLHDAMFQYEDPSKEPGVVGNVAFPGYTIYDRVLRPAKVGVIKKSEPQE